MAVAANFPTAIASYVMASNLIGRLDQVVSNAGSQGNMVLMQGGRQISLAIEQFRNVYEAQLRETAETVDTTVQRQLQAFESMVLRLEQATVTDLNALINQVSEIVHELPFRDHEPELFNVKPRFISSQTEVRFIGRFDRTGRTDLKPTLTVNGQTFQGENTRNELRFEVSSGQLFPNQEAVARATLTLPWIKPPPQNLATLAVGGEGTRTVNTFQVSLFSLPKSPGRVVVEWITRDTSPKTETADRLGTQYIQSSAAHWGHVGYPPNAGNGVHRVLRQAHFQQSYSKNVTRGWIIASGRVHVFDSRGNFTVGPATIAPNSISVNIATRNTGHHRSGGVWFQFRYQEQRHMTEIKETRHTHTITDLDWGLSRVVDIDGSTNWKVTLFACDGRYEFCNPTNHQFIQITAGNRLEISAPRIETLDFFRE